jgi:hypothetical protein
MLTTSSPTPRKPGGHEGGEEQHQRCRVPHRVLDAEHDHQVDEVTEQHQAEGVPPAGPLPDGQGDGGQDAQAHRGGVEPGRCALAEHAVHEEVDRAHHAADDEQRGQGEGGDAVLRSPALRGVGHVDLTQRGGLPPSDHRRRMQHNRSHV